MELESTWEINAPAINVGRRGVSRPPQEDETFSLILGALATYDRLAKVTVGNIHKDGKKTAVAIFEDAHFAKNAEGDTRLKKEDKHGDSQFS